MGYGSWVCGVGGEGVCVLYWFEWCVECVEVLLCLVVVCVFDGECDLYVCEFCGEDLEVFGKVGVENFYYYFDVCFVEEGEVVGVGG